MQICYLWCPMFRYQAFKSVNTRGSVISIRSVNGRPKDRTLGVCFSEMELTFPQYKGTSPTYMTDDFYAVMTTWAWNYSLVSVKCRQRVAPYSTPPIRHYVVYMVNVTFLSEYVCMCFTGFHTCTIWEARWRERQQLILLGEYVATRYLCFVSHVASYRCLLF
jgi:hypothetical protein